MEQADNSNPSGEFVHFSLDWRLSEVHMVLSSGKQRVPWNIPQECLSSVQDSESLVIISDLCCGRSANRAVCRLVNSYNIIFEKKVVLQTGQFALKLPILTTFPFPYLL
jgi:hypothetical protein